MHVTPASDIWQRGSPYEQYMGRWSRRVAPRFLAWLHVPIRRRWLDVGCGTGALSAAILDHCSPASVTAIEPSDGFLHAARSNLAGRGVVLQGSATSIPLERASVDVAVSGLVLNFVEDKGAALAEMLRVTTGGGTVAAYVWDYAGRMEMIRLFWDTAIELDPAAVDLDEGIRFPLCYPDALEKLFTTAGLTRVEVDPIDITTPFASFEDYWEPFLGGQGPAPSYATSLESDDRRRLRARLHERLPIAGDGTITLVARAWAVRGQVPRTH